MPYKEKPIDKKYYSIGELADILSQHIGKDIATSHLRFYEAEFGIKVKYDRKGNRQFTPEQVDRFKIVFHYYATGDYTTQALAKVWRHGFLKTNLPFDATPAVNALKAFRKSLIRLRDSKNNINGVTSIATKEREAPTKRHRGHNPTILQSKKIRS